MNEVLTYAVAEMLTHVLFIFFAFKALRALRLEQLIRKNHVQEARLFYLMLSIALGYTVSSFFLELIELSRNIAYLLVR